MKRRFTVNATKGYIITAVIFMLGILMLLWGFLTYLGFKKGQNALSISELKESQIKDGQYVRGVIHEIAGYYKYVGYEYRFYCTPGASILGGETYKYFTVKIDGEKYINIFVNEEDWKLIKELESYVEGKGNSAYFEGKVVKALPGDELEDDWYQNALGIESKEEIDEVVISDYFIIQDSFEIDTKKFTTGFLLIIVSIFYFFFSGGVKGLLVYWGDEKESE
ncbi:MAG: hypothetical protein IJA10_00135 [Lachnospiraceae bacterium]|nr:hypothetical protein [Lachnospiraceae bacterium]